MEEKRKEKVVFLSGIYDKINLRPPDKETDLEKFLVWINNQEIIQFMSRFLPVNHSQEEKWFNKEGEKEIVLVIETKEGMIIGDIGLHNIDYRNGTADLGIMIGDKNYWRQGFGYDAEMTLLKYAFNTLNLRKIIHCAFLLNRGSVNLAKKCGGIQEGLLKKHIFSNNEYHNMVILAIFKENWRDKYDSDIYETGGFEH